jgi:Sulfotransferase domain
VIDGPDFMIIGAMKSATSTLHEQLAATPGFFMSRPKEPSFFSDDDVWSRGLDWYAGLFAAAPADALKGESSTHYTKLPTYPHTLDRLGASVRTRRFVYVMRHPVDRLVSHYIHEWSQGVFSESLDDAVERRPELVEYGCYARQLTPWIERFGKAAILPVFFERLAAMPSAELERVGRFLGHSQPLAWKPELGRQNVSSERLRKSALRDAILDSPLLTQLRRRVLPRALRDRIKARWQMRERPALSASARQRVERRFDEDLATLGGWLGTPLSCASYHDVVLARSLEWSGAR